MVILLVLMGAFIGAPYFYQPVFEPPRDAQLNDFLAADRTDSAEDRASVHADSRPVTADAFPFDPNTIGVEDWIRLGIAERTAKTILKYRSKGGKFRTPADLRRIWGIRPADAERLIPFVRIREGEQPAPSGKNDQYTAVVKTRTEQIRSIDINTAGLEEWKALPGIGEVLGNRIIKYRERQGGFLSVQDLSKTYGISDSLFGRIRDWLRFDPATVPKFHINMASLYELRSRLGISYGSARAILNNREQHGLYHSLEEIRAVTVLPDSSWQKLLLIGVLD